MARDNLRIAMLGHKRIPSREGGIEIVVGELSSRMASRGHRVTCYNRKGHHVSGADFDHAQEKEYNGVRLKSVFTIEGRGLAAMTASFSASICTALGKYDVVHFHAEGPCAALWIPKFFGKRCVATIHGLDHQRAKWGRFASWYIHFGEKCAVRYADEIIVLSKGVQQYFKDTYDRDTVLIPNGVNRSEQKKARIITEKYGLNKDDYILFLARLVPEKGLQYLIRAFKQLKTDKKLVIAGGASEATGFVDELKALAGDDPRIIFTGFIQGEELEEMYSNAYLYVLPSDLEGMPLSLLEAMSYGNCCLTSDIPECADVIQDMGYTFKQSDEADLLDKLTMLCENPEKVDKIRAQAADFICNCYNWDDVTDRTIELYRRKK